MGHETTQLTRRTGGVLDEPGIFAPVVAPSAPRSFCTDCGVSRTAEPKRCASACQFIRPDYEGLETKVHGRARDPERADELHFGPYRSMLRARLTEPSDGAQWTGIATRIGERLLAGGHVDAVLTVAPDPNDRWRPVPVIVTEPEAMAHCRGMRMGYAPLLALLEPARAAGYRRLAVIGIPCQVYALRALEEQLGLDRLYVVGTPCSDNTTTENFHAFLARLDDAPETINYLEFRPDYRVEIRFDGPRAHDPVPNLADQRFAARLLDADLPHLRGLHQRAVGRDGRLHGRRTAAMAAGAQRTRVRGCWTCSARSFDRSAWTTRASARRGGRVHRQYRARGGRPARAADAETGCARSCLGSSRVSARAGWSSRRTRVEMKAAETHRARLRHAARGG